MSHRVSDEDLKWYLEAKTFPNTPGDDLKRMARELLAARKVVASARENWMDCSGSLKEAIDAYDAATAGGTGVE